MIAGLLFNFIDFLFDKRQNRKFKEYSADTVIARDVPYGSGPLNKLDYYYRPKKDGKYPVIINFHGGGFMAGDKKHRRALSAYYANMGFFVVNANYVLSPKCRFPEPVYNAVAAINWVADNAKIFNLDVSKIAVSGDSAGGYFAAMLAAICVNKDLQTKLGVTPKATVGAAVLNCGLYDVMRARKMLFGVSNQVFKAFTGTKKKAFDSYEYKETLSPIPFINESFPPSFVVQSTKDIFCKGQAELVYEQMDKHGVRYQKYVSVKFKRNHCYSLTWLSKEARETNEQIKNFLSDFIEGKFSCEENPQLPPLNLPRIEKPEERYSA